MDVILRAGAVVTLLLLSLTLAKAEAGHLAVSRAYYRDTNTSLHLLLVNKGGEPIEIAAPVVDGFDASTLSDGENEGGKVLWYRCRPNPVPPGGMADLTVVLATAQKSAVVEVRTTSGDAVRRTVRCAPEQMRFQAVRFSRDLRAVDVYVRWADSSKASGLRKLRLDGVDVRERAMPWPARAHDGIAFARISLDRLLEENSFHVLEVEDDRGNSTYSQVRALPAEFLIGVYGVPTPGNIADWASHGCNHYLSFGAVSPEVVEELGRHGISVGAKYISEPLADTKAGRVVGFNKDAARAVFREMAGKEAFLYHHLVDEPDVADYYAGRRLGATAMELAARAEFCEETDPGRYTFVQLDNTFRPNNYRVYGEAADVLATHRYSLGSFLRSEAGEEKVMRPAFLEDMLETLVRLRSVTEPRPLFMVTQFFHLGPGRSGRPPAIEEMRLQCYAMIMGGARGLIHYIHSGSSGGGEGGRAKPLWGAMTRLHEEIRGVGDILAVGTPAPEGWVKCDSPHVLAGGLLCGDGMAVVLINRSHRSSLDTFVARPVREATVSVKVPPWIKAAGLGVVCADGAPAVERTVRGSTLSFVVDEVKDARCFLLARKQRGDSMP